MEWFVVALNQPHGVLVTLSNNWLSFTLHTYQAELFPTRARAIGFVYAWVPAFSAGRRGRYDTFYRDAAGSRERLPRIAG